jgi:hypothetical protein
LYQVYIFEIFFRHYYLKPFSAFCPKSIFDIMSVHPQDISSANIAGLPDSRYQYASLIAGGFEKDNINQTRSQ